MPSQFITSSKERAKTLIRIQTKKATLQGHTERWMQTKNVMKYIKLFLNSTNWLFKIEKIDIMN